MNTDDTIMPVEVQTKFDQFPATIKGAFVMSGADGNPHAVDLEEAKLGRVPQGRTKDIPLEAVRVDVAPGRDLFVPFEVAVSDLEAGWYALFSSVQVDAGRSWTFFSRAFSVPWAREDVRRGTVKAGRTVMAGLDGFIVEAVEMRSDCAVVSWRSAAGALSASAVPPAT